jgi:hypothetical protein
MYYTAKAASGVFTLPRVTSWCHVQMIQHAYWFPLTFQPLCLKWVELIGPQSIQLYNKSGMFTDCLNKSNDWKCQTPNRRRKSWWDTPTYVLHCKSYPKIAFVRSQVVSSMAMGPTGSFINEQSVTIPNLLYNWIDWGPISSTHFKHKGWNVRGNFTNWQERVNST